MKRGIIGIFIILILAAVLYVGINSVFATTQSGFIWSDPALYRQDDKVSVVADVRLFTTMSLFNAVYGFDGENGPAMHPAREQVRQALAERLAKVPAKQVARWKKFYEKKPYHLYQYVSYTMSLSETHPFRPVLQAKGTWLQHLLDHFTGLNGFDKIMNEFWTAMNLQSLWQEVLPYYIAEIEKWDLSRIIKEETMVWDYVRKVNPDYSRHLVSVPNLLDSHYSAFALDYDTYYFAVSSPGSHNYGLNIHEYLHGVLGPVIDKHYAKEKDKLQAYFFDARDNEMISNNYNSLPTFIEENMVRAVDLRIRILNQLGDPQAIRGQIEPQERQGFNLILVFYNLLQEYEQDHLTFEEYLDKIFEMVPYYEDYLRFKQ